MYNCIIFMILMPFIVPILVFLVFGILALVMQILIAIGDLFSKEKL